MFKAKKANRHKQRRRTSLEIEEEQSRTLYIRLPHTIKKVDEIKSLFFGDYKVKMPRQSSRYCHVIFNDVEDKIKNLKAVKKTLIDGKPIYAGPPKPINLEKPKKPRKKVKMPDPTTPSNAGKYIFVSNIPPGIKAPEVKAAFPGAVTVALLKGLVNGKRNAKLKMSSPQLCSRYAKDKDNWPVFKEQKVCVRLAKKSSSSKKKANKQKKTPLKIHDGESEQKEQSKEKESDSKDADSAGSDEEGEESDSKSADSAGSDEEDGSEEEEEEDAEEESSSEEEE